MSKFTADEMDVQREHHSGLVWYYNLEIIRAQVHAGLTDAQRGQIIRAFEKLKSQAQAGVELWSDE